MPSPFPVLDPFIESCGLWGDFHDRLIGALLHLLEESLPRHYVARMNQRSYIVLAEENGKGEHSFLPDVSVSTSTSRPPARAQASEATTATEPVLLRAFIEEDFEEKFIDIFELEPERRLVTSIEVLSPSNKKRRSLGWKKYLRKRQALLLGKANLVELDLLRGGTRMPMLDPWPGSPYTLLVSREEQSPRCRVWPASFDRPLPAIP